MQSEQFSFNESIKKRLIMIADMLDEFIMSFKLLHYYYVVNQIQRTEYREIVLNI